jgi:hypothetical protein
MIPIWEITIILGMPLAKLDAIVGTRYSGKWEDKYKLSCNRHKK